MDWISHLLFSFSLGAILLKDMSREKIVLVAMASLLPDLDILWYHRSAIHSPLVLLAFALLLSIKKRELFTPLLTGLWSHTALDIFLFDNSKHTIRNLADQIVGNDSIAQNIEDNITGYIAADGIMLFYPFSQENFSMILNEESYAIAAGSIIIIAALSFLWFVHKEKKWEYAP